MLIACVGTESRETSGACSREEIKVEENGLSKAINKQVKLYDNMIYLSLDLESLKIYSLLHRVSS